MLGHGIKRTKYACAKITAVNVTQNQYLERKSHR